VEAKESVQVCRDTSCPAVIQQDCSRWSDELDASLPTIVLGAQAADGHDLPDVQTILDGVDVSTRPVGQAMPVDPGQHAVRYVLADGRSIEQQFVTREGQKDRSLVMRFPAATGDTKPVSSSGSADRANTVAAVTTGALGVVLVGVGIYFTVHQSSQTNSLESMCAHGACAPGSEAYDALSSEVSTVNTNRALAGASFGVAAGLIGTATYFLLARPLGKQAHAASQVGLSVEGIQAAPAHRGGVVGYRLVF
jgi:hypothetical protein